MALAISGLSTASAQDLSALEAAARANRNDAAAQTAYGEALLRAGQYREARGAFQSAVRIERTAEAQFNVARVAFRSGDYRQARAACRPLERIDGATVLFHVCMARTFLVWNRSARAFESIEAALAADANNFEALVALGDAHRLRGAIEDAEAAYRRATSANGSSPRPYVGLGQAYLSQRRRSDAIAQFRRAYELDRTSPDTNFYLGSTVPVSEGLAYLRAAATARPTWPEAHMVLGRALLRSDDVAAARESFTEALRLSDDYADAHVGLGRCHLHAEEFEEAIASFERALEQVPNMFPAVLGVADTYRATERTEEAFAEYRRAAGLNPRNPRPLLAAAELALEKNRDVLAVGFLDNVLRVHPENAKALALYGDAMAARRDRAQARSYYQRALRARGDIDRARVQRALSEL